MSGDRFEVRGAIKIDQVWQPHSRIVDAPSESLAKERFYALVGSKHQLKRNLVRIEEIRKLD